MNWNAHSPARVRVAAAQINTVLGDLAGNTEKILDRIALARERGVQILVFPELALCGYPPKDLLLKPQFISDQRGFLERIVPETKGMLAMVGCVTRDGDSYNSAAVMHDGRLEGFARKVCLPNYRVFDEKRYFRRGEYLSVFKTDAANVGVLICEDLWHPETVSNMAASGVDLMVCLSASPFSAGKCIEREIMVKSRCQDHGAAMVFCNQVGGQDELIFDGRSLIVDSGARTLAEGVAFEEDFVEASIVFGDIHRRRLAVPVQRDSPAGGEPGREPVRIFETGGRTAPIDLRGEPGNRDRHALRPVESRYDPAGDVYRALVTGVRDYVRKNGFSTVAIGLSGGIDSALTASIAVDALGPDKVVGVSMPSRYSSEHSKSDARELAGNMGIAFKQFAIENVFQTYLDLFADEFAGRESDITEENLQARIRGALLMALSNKFGHLVLATGNKSELAVGYATLYGDMCGGLAVIGDAPKTWVYGMCRHRNRDQGGPWIPEAIISKPPSAELRDNQLDTDSLPPYDVLDGILHAYIEQDASIAEIVALGYEEATVRRVVNLVDRAEYKRRQAAVVLRITSKAFGSDRRLPITNKYQS